MKRFAAAALWLYAFWYLGSTIAFFAGIPDLLGPVLGIAAGLIVGIDHRHIIWARDRAKQATSQPSSAVPSAA